MIYAPTGRRGGNGTLGLLSALLGIYGGVREGQAAKRDDRRERERRDAQDARTAAQSDQQSELLELNLRNARQAPALNELSQVQQQYQQSPASQAALLQRRAEITGGRAEVTGIDAPGVEPVFDATPPDLSQGPPAPRHSTGPIRPQARQLASILSGLNLGKTDQQLSQERQDQWERRQRRGARRAIEGERNTSPSLAPAQPVPAIPGVPATPAVPGSATPAVPAPTGFALETDRDAFPEPRPNRLPEAVRASTGGRPLDRQRYPATVGPDFSSKRSPDARGQAGSEALSPAQRPWTRPDEDRLQGLISGWQIYYQQAAPGWVKSQIKQYIQNGGR